MAIEFTCEPEASERVTITVDRSKLLRARALAVICDAAQAGRGRLEVRATPSRVALRPAMGWRINDVVVPTWAATSTGLTRTLRRGLAGLDLAQAVEALSGPKVTLTISDDDSMLVTDGSVGGQVIEALDLPYDPAPERGREPAPSDQVICNVVKLQEGIAAYRDDIRIADEHLDTAVVIEASSGSLALRGDGSAERREVIVRIVPEKVDGSLAAPVRLRQLIVVLRELLGLPEHQDIATVRLMGRFATGPVLQIGEYQIPLDWWSAQAQGRRA